MRFDRNFFNYFCKYFWEMHVLERTAFFSNEIFPLTKYLCVYRILIVILLLYISWLTLVWFYISISCLPTLSSIYGSQKWLITKILMWSIGKLYSWNIACLNILMCVLILSKTLGTLKQNHCYTQLIYPLSRKKFKNIHANLIKNTYQGDSYHRHILMVSICKEIDFDTVECLRV